MSKAKFTEGEKVCVSLATLWDTLRESVNGRRTRCGDLVVHTEQPGKDWYDLYADGCETDFDGPVCCDGETCEVEHVCQDGTVYFRNPESDQVFVLSADEAGTACFGV